MKIKNNIMEVIESGELDSIRLRLNGLLFAITGSNTLVDRWWSTPNKEFGMQTPVEVFQTDPKSVAKYILSYANQ